MNSTLWSSNYAAYDRLTPTYQKFLEGLTGLNDAERFRIQARENGFKLRTEPRGSPYNAGDAFQASHPLIRCVSPFRQPGEELPSAGRVTIADILVVQHEPCDRSPCALRQPDIHQANQRAQL